MTWDELYTQYNQPVLLDLIGPDGDVVGVVEVEPLIKGCYMLARHYITGVTEAGAVNGTSQVPANYVFNRILET